MKQLPADTVRLLSSSQVVTSVVSVVKELVENALDAGASSVDVKLENFGLDRTEVRDNGCGIKAADAAVMAVRHFTSKISSHEDLERLQTYGFRGEALGSICAVAEVTVATKTEEDAVGTQYSLDSSGGVVSQRPSHLGGGTSVSVAKLFGKLPVRRQFFSSVRKRKEEVRKVQDLLMAFAVIKPELRLTLAHNKVVVWQKARAADLRSALVATLGASTVTNLLPVHQEQPEMVLDGFLPKPGADLSLTSSCTSDKTFLFINKRPVQQKDILKLLRQHHSAQYPDAAARHRFPVLLLNLTVCPSSLDVNVTPDKTQVLLHNKDAVLAAIEALLVSLYGFRPEKQPDPETLPPAAGCVETGENMEDRKVSDEDAGQSAALQHQASSCSSSSSTADDWIVNQSGSSVCDDEATRSRPPSAELGPEERRRLQVSAEAWSRGAALTDPASGEALQPVAIHRPDPEVKRSGNAVTEKRAALTAYDMVSSRALRAPPSAAALFDKEVRPEVLMERPAAGLQEVGAAVQNRWENLGDEGRKRFEEQQRKSQDLHDQRTRLAAHRPPRAQKRKAPLSNQQLLDQLFSAQRKEAPPPKAWRPLPCSVAALRRRLRCLAARSGAAEPRGFLRPLGPLRPLGRLPPQAAWLVVCGGRRLMLLNPFRAQEALLFQRLQQDQVLPAVRLQNPLPLTDRNLGAAAMETLCGLERGAAEPDGSVFLSDPRLVANGFRIRLSPERRLEATAMADCVPFLGLEDLREVLTAVHQGKDAAATVPQSRPLKVTNYLKAEAVRLARQLPSELSREEVEELLEQTERRLGGTNRTCIHGRLFLHHLADVPSSQQEARLDTHTHTPDQHTPDRHTPDQHTPDRHT